MTSTFDRAFELLIGHEGGYVNHPADPGGETKYGITKRSYPNEDIRGMTLARAKAIYRRDYWDAARCEEMAPMLALLVFDSAVNNGRGNAVRFLQRALDVADDGIIGPVTLATLRAADLFAVAERFQAQRIGMMSRLSTWPNFGKGWAARLAVLPVQAACLQFGEAAGRAVNGEPSVPLE